MTDRDEPLFAGDAVRHPRGRVRIGLDADVKVATDAEARLPSAGVATLRSLADQIDQLERQLRSPYAKPYDRVPLAGLVREFRESYEQVFAALARAEDPLTHALAQFLATDAGPDEPGRAEIGDTQGPVIPQ
jgi:hypothetical protein